MLWVDIGLYTLALAVIWGFFIVLKIHAYKFKNFSNNITKVTSILFIFLLSLSLLGYIFIFLGFDGDTNYEVNIQDNTNKFSEIDY